MKRLEKINRALIRNKFHCTFELVDNRVTLAPSPEVTRQLKSGKRDVSKLREDLEREGYVMEVKIPNHPSL